MSETVPISRKSVTGQADDFGPRMILLGAAGLLHAMAGRQTPNSPVASSTMSLTDTITRQQGCC